MNMRKITMLFVCLLVLSLPAFGMGGKESRRNVQRDVQKAAGVKLEPGELDIANFVVTFYCVRYGYKADTESFDTDIKSLTTEQYEHAISQAAIVAKHPLSQGLLKAGKTGEKILKALIVTIEEGAEASKEWIDAQSGKYETKKP